MNIDNTKEAESRPLAGTLLSLDQIAEAFHVSRNHARDVLVKRPDFPRPAVATSQKCRRWRYDDVAGWIERQWMSNRR